MRWVFLIAAFTAGAIPHIWADLAAMKCPICRRGYACWPIRNHLRRWTFVCRHDFKIHRQERARISA